MLNKISDSAESVIDDSDRDALHILPLAIIPFSTPKLRTCRMLKNSRLESVVELFGGSGSGSGQIYPDLLHHEYSWPQGPSDPDYLIAKKLSRLSSYDVYSLRLLLRQHGINVEHADYFRLSDDMERDLSSYMLPFTRPLIKEVFGKETEHESFHQMIASLDNAIPDHVRENLINLANRLGIEVFEIPEFLEDYGDVYLSLSYFRNEFDKIVPQIDGFMESASEICNSRQLKNNHNLISTCRTMANTFSEKMTDVVGILESFSNNTSDMWDGMTRTRFNSVANNIIKYHTTVGGILCMLSVKLASWQDRFPDVKTGGLNRRGDFILSDMKQGMDEIINFDTKVPLLTR